ncbi:hypothetical protein VTJ83DRAFT_3243 [Remersonia thermophila]|uniref:Uncharacterized protein n=1 Tax=Remersonia thermophila TaxID=72144 RepID=A0ABR4DFN4_9PEZI
MALLWALLQRFDSCTCPTLTRFAAPDVVVSASQVDLAGRTLAISTRFGRHGDRRGPGLLGNTKAPGLQETLPTSAIRFLGPLETRFSIR